MPEAQIAVLIDFENVGLESIQSLFDQLSNMGRIIVKRAYADWSSAARRRDEVLEMGIEAVHNFRATRSAKNSADIRLAIDAVDLLYQSPVDTFVIVSADTDFVALVSKLRAAGKTVVGAGRRDVVSPTLVRSCDRYIFLNGPEGGTRQVAPGRVSERGAEALLARAIEVSADDQGRVPGSRLHQTMARMDPSFNFADLGFSSFAKFLEASPLVKVTRSRGQADIIVELKGPGPSGVLSKVSANLGRIRGPQRREPRSPSGAEASAPPAEPALASLPPAAREPSPAPETSSWDQRVHEVWSQRAAASGDHLNGTWAAGEAASVLGVPKLSASPYKTLQSLLDASALLSSSWARDGNTLHRKG